MINKNIDHKLTEEEIKEYIEHYKKKYSINYNFWTTKVGVDRTLISRLLHGRNGKPYKLSDKTRTAFTREIEKMVKKFI